MQTKQRKLKTLIGGAAAGLLWLTVFLFIPPFSRLRIMLFLFLLFLSLFFFLSYITLRTKISFIISILFTGILFAFSLF